MFIRNWINRLLKAKDFNSFKFKPTISNIGRRKSNYLKFKIFPTSTVWAKHSGHSDRQLARGNTFSVRVLFSSLDFLTEISHLSGSKNPKKRFRFHLRIASTSSSKCPLSLWRSMRVSLGRLAARSFYSDLLGFLKCSVEL